jgi:predicted transcriptional regulator
VLRGRLEHVTSRMLGSTPTAQAVLSSPRPQSDKANQHRVYAIGKPAAVLMAAGVGDAVIASGLLSSSMWNDAEGQSHSKTELQARAVEIVATPVELPVVEPDPAELAALEERALAQIRKQPGLSTNAVRRALLAEGYVRYGTVSAALNRLCDAGRVDRVAGPRRAALWFWVPTLEEEQAADEERQTADMDDVLAFVVGHPDCTTSAVTFLSFRHTWRAADILHRLEAAGRVSSVTGPGKSGKGSVTRWTVTPSLPA